MVYVVLVFLNLLIAVLYFAQGGSFATIIGCVWLLVATMNGYTAYMRLSR